MTAILPMSVISLVLGFLVSVMGGFSAIAGAGSPDQSTAVEEPGSSAEEVSAMFQRALRGVLSDTHHLQLRIRVEVGLKDLLLHTLLSTNILAVILSIVLIRM